MSWDPHFGRAHCETVMSVYKPIVLFSIFYDINPSEHYKWNWDPEKNSFYYIGYPINPSENWIFKNQKKLRWAEQTWHGPLFCTALVEMISPSHCDGAVLWF